MLCIHYQLASALPHITFSPEFKLTEHLLFKKMPIIRGKEHSEYSYAVCLKSSPWRGHITSVYVSLAKTSDMLRLMLMMSEQRAVSICEQRDCRIYQHIE